MESYIQKVTTTGAKASAATTAYNLNPPVNLPAELHEKPKLKEKFKVELTRDDLPGQQKKLWQQLQLLKLLRQDYKGMHKNMRGVGQGRSSQNQ